MKNAYPKAEIVDCSDIMLALRRIKSENELACIREGFRIIEKATDAVIDALRPGVTELEMVGVAQKAVYENGAEYEGLPMYVFSEASTRHAISRPGYRQIGKGDIVQLNLSAKVDGYSPSIGLPYVRGNLPARRNGLSSSVWKRTGLRNSASVPDGVLPTSPGNFTGFIGRTGWNPDTYTVLATVPV